MQKKNSFLGTGINYPLRVNTKGELALVSGVEDIEQSIRIILGTIPGERVMRPTFGCRVHELLFEPRNATTIGQLQDYVEQALLMWEPRVEIIRINVNNEESPSAYLVEIEFKIKATHDIRSIVHPFYIADEEEIA